MRENRAFDKSIRMSHRDAPTPIPRQQSRTVRQQIIDRLRGSPVSVGELSGDVGLPEKRIREELESLHRQVRLEIKPARCGKCGFEFRERRRARKPGKCPKCRGTYIEEPLFSISG